MQNPIRCPAQIVVKEYKGIEVEKFIHTITDDEVEKELIRCSDPIQRWKR